MKFLRIFDNLQPDWKLTDRLDMKEYLKKSNFLTVFLFIKIYLLTLSVFTSFRIILFIFEFNKIGDAKTLEILQAFLIGIRFDIVISTYILFLPFFLLSSISFFKRSRIVFRKFSFYFIFVLFSLTFLVCSADIPYFDQFFSRISITAFNWFNTPGFVFLMIIQEPRLWVFFLLFLIITVIYYLNLKSIFNKEISQDYYTYNFFYPVKITVTIIALGLMFIGIRGRIEGLSPIRVGTAFFCNNALLNNLGLNPNFTLIRSYLDAKDELNKDVRLMDDKEAIKNVQNYLNIQHAYNFNPISRRIVPKESQKVKHNVIIVLMESMSTAKMKRHGNTDNLTPFLDSISNEGYYFENFYSAGIHTYNGIFSTLFSYPTLFCQLPMRESAMNSYPGIAGTLKNHGYRTIFITTHDAQFDNIGGFLKNNDFEMIIEKQDYPKSKIKTVFGVPDDFMFEYSISLLNSLYKSGSPFLAAMLTTSDHKPYYVPEYFHPHNSEMQKQVIEYADFSLRKFISMASKEKWFENTIFVFVADHGFPMSLYYELSLDYLHCPLLFYAPAIIKDRKTISKMAGQIDVFPSIMGLLKLPYVNSTMGINLFEEDRPYIFFNNDDLIGVIDENWLLVITPEQNEHLYRYKNHDIINYSVEFPKVTESMKTYAESYMQAFQYLLNSQVFKTIPKIKK